MTNTVSQVPIPEPPKSGVQHVLSQRASFWVAASVVMHTLWTSAAPAMTYPLYASEWHLTPTVTTAIFAVYPLVVVTVLIFFGDISDYIGWHGLSGALCRSTVATHFPRFHCGGRNWIQPIVFGWAEQILWLDPQIRSGAEAKEPV